MSAQIVFVRVHELEAVREIIQEALKLTNTITVDEPSADAIFSKAVDLLAARVTRPFLSAFRSSAPSGIVGCGMS